MAEYLGKSKVASEVGMTFFLSFLPSMLIWGTCPMLNDGSLT